MHILDDIYGMFVETVTSPVNEKEYKELNSAAGKLEAALYGLLTPEQKELYKQFTNAQAKVNMYYEQRFFAQSITFGAMLMLELTREEL